MAFVRLKVRDAKASKWYTVKVPTDAPVHKFKMALLDGLNLPKSDYRGQPLYYIIRDNQSGKILSDHQCLGDAGVGEGGELCVELGVTPETRSKLPEFPSVHGLEFLEKLSRDIKKRPYVWGVAGFLIIGFLSLLPSNLGPADKANRTYTFWCKVKQITVEAANARRDESRESMRVAMHAISSRIDVLNTKGVDEDAVICVGNFSEVCRRAAAYEGKVSNPAFLIESIARGASGDPWSVPMNAINEQNQLGEQFQNVMSQINRTRAVLTSRYNIEFPLIN